MKRIAIQIMAVVLCVCAVVQAEDIARRTARRTPVVDVFEKTRDAVVSIKATQVVESTFPSFDSFFAPSHSPRTGRYTSTSLGSGFVIHDDGYVVTNAHVVNQAASLDVIFADQRDFRAEIIAIDESNDLAVLKIEPDKPIHSIMLGRSDDLMVGETVVAIGNPLGYQHTVTSGIISATEREVQTQSDSKLEHLIQTDASINRGNSGGPLLNVLGELIGINTAIRGDAQNIGFAIPVDSLRKLLPEMLSLERRKRLAVGLRLSWRGKVFVVEATGPAEAAGVQPGDELVSVDGEAIRNDVDFHIMMLRMTKDDHLALQFRRGDELVSATIQPKPIPIPDGKQLLKKKLGLGIRLLTAKEAKTLDLKGGLIITDVEPGSPAARTGLQPGWIVVQIGKYLPADLDEVGLILEHVTPGSEVALRLWRIERRFIRVYNATLAAR